MSDINEILNVLFAFRLGLPVVWKDYYGSWWEVHRDHTFDFHNEYRIVYDRDVDTCLNQLNKQ